MASPAKKRKNLPNTQPTRTLHYFFEKQTATKKEALGSAPTSDPQLGPSALTDGQYANELAEEWKHEDKASRNATPSLSGESSRTGAKRHISNSPITNATASSSLAYSGEEEQKDSLTSATPQASQAATPVQKPNAPPSILQTPKEIAASAEDVREMERTIDSMPFDEDPLKFNPDNYQTTTRKLPGGKATYALLTHAFVLINSTRSRIRIVDTLVNFLRVLIRLDPDSLLPAVSS